MKFSTERRNEKENFPFPVAGERVFETPPTFVWLSVEGASEYTLTVSDKDGKAVEKLNTGRTFATPDKELSPGEYSYTVSSDNGAVTDSIPFTVDKDAIVFRRPTAKELFDAIPTDRPRHLFSREDIPRLRKLRSKEIETLKRNAQLAYSHGLPEAPRFHKDPEALPYREYFGRFRDFCDRDLVATSTLFALIGDKAAGEHAHRLLMRICENSLFEENFNTGAALFGKFGDEVGLSIARCLPAVFDLLYPVLTPSERETVCRVIKIYAEQCKARLEHTDYIHNPSNSHVGRLPAYLGEAAIALKGTGTVSDATLLSWLRQALEIYCGIFPYYGGADGSWAEGAFYSTSYTKWYLPFFSAVERFTGKSLADRPFYHRLTGFLYHFAHPDYENHPFGDGYWCSPESPEWPGFFAEDPFRYYADKFGPTEAKYLSDRLGVRDHYSLHLLDLFLPVTGSGKSKLAHSPRNAEIFPDGGFAILHSDVHDPDRITVMARASRFGSDSHRHADQGSFAIFAGGTAMISPSGYFGREFGTLHHQKWTNATLAHNVPLINGEGQPNNSRLSRGRIAALDEENSSVTLDISDAYSGVDSFIRVITLDGNTVTVRDSISSSSPVTVEYPLHTLSEPTAVGNTVTVIRKGREMTVTPISGELTLVGITDKFATELNEGVPAEYAVDMPVQYHVTYAAPAATVHDITVVYRISKAHTQE